MEDALEELRPIWQRAIADQVVTTPLDEIRARTFDRVLHLEGRARALSPTERRRLEQILSDRRLRHLLESELARHRSFFRAVVSIWNRARRENWRPGEWQDAVLSLAELWAAGGYLLQLLETGVILPANDGGAAVVERDPEVARAWPYLEFLTRVEADKADPDPPGNLPPGTVRVRDPHLELHGFIARTVWEGWDQEVRPPLDWACRCRLRRVTYLEARERGLRGDFPVGEAKLEAFRAAGGSEDDFPRDFFVEGAVVG